MCVRWCRCSALGDVALIWGPTVTGVVAGQPAQYSSRCCRHTVRFRVNEMERQKKTSFRGQSGAGYKKIAWEEVACWAQFPFMIEYSEKELRKGAM